MPDITNADLFGHLKAALTDLVEHARDASVCGPGCLWSTDPTSQTFGYSAYRDAVDLLEVVKRKDDVIVLDTMSSPIPGVASVAVPGGEITIDMRTGRVVLSPEWHGPLTWKPEDAHQVGAVLVYTAREAGRQPDPTDVQALADLITAYQARGVDEVTLAHHLLSSGYRKTGDE